MSRFVAERHNLRNELSQTARGLTRDAPGSMTIRVNSAADRCRTPANGQTAAAPRTSPAKSTTCGFEMPSSRCSGPNVGPNEDEGRRGP
jgi:hypothetical protein